MVGFACVVVGMVVVAVAGQVACVLVSGCDREVQKTLCERVWRLSLWAMYALQVQ